MIDEISGWGIDVPVILAGGAYGDNTQFRQGLSDRGLSWVLDVNTPPRPIRRPSSLRSRNIRVGGSHPSAVTAKIPHRCWTSHSPREQTPPRR
jgi:hypothetical protein